MGILSRGTDPRGCNVARKATWQSHASPCERLHGVEVARTRGSATQVHADTQVAPRGMSSDWAGK